MTDPADDWHQPLRHLRAADLSADTGQTPGTPRNLISRRRPPASPPTSPARY